TPTGTTSTPRPLPWWARELWWRLREPRHLGSVPGALDLHGEVLVGVPALDLAPPGRKEIAKLALGALAQAFGARLLQVEPLVSDLTVFGHRVLLGVWPTRVLGR